jgi:AraC-like DNA-binding protein
MDTNSHKQTLDGDWSSFFSFRSGEIWKYLNFDSRFSCQLPIARHPFLIFVLEGSISFQDSNGENASLNGLQAMLIAPDRFRSVQISDTFRAFLCHFPAEILYASNNLVAELTALVQTDFSEYKIDINKTFHRFLLLLVQYMNSGILRDYLAEMKRNELFILLFAYYEKAEMAQFFRYFLEGDVNFMKFVTDNYVKASNVKELAAMANYSVSGFIKKFRKSFGQPPYKWMQKQKAWYILQEMSSGEKSLQVIAAENNFSSYQHFATFCQRMFKMPPTEVTNKKILIKMQAKTH